MSEFDHASSLAADGVTGRQGPLTLGLFNVKYSPNLGDGLLSECLEAELARNIEDLAIRCFDLAGREQYQEGARYRTTALSVLQSSPTLVRHAISEIVLGRKLKRQLRPRWRAGLRGVDAVVVGGGNLFSDSDLNFPLKVDAALAEARATGLPTAIFSVGVSDNWSPRGEHLFRRALSGTRLIDVSVREPRSAEIWRRRLAPSGVPVAQVVHDPGLLTAEHMPAGAGSDDPRPVLGLGLTHPSALRYHGDERGVGDGELTQWFRALVEAFVDRGWRVCAFTNGSPEDEDYLAQVRASVADLALADAVEFVPRFPRPADLAAFVSQLDLLMAHRLHANIAAYSYQVPNVGFSWDRKLKDFLTQVGRGDYVCAAGIDPTETAVDLGMRAARDGVDARRHARMVAEARSHVSALAGRLRATPLQHFRQAS